MSLDEALEPLVPTAVQVLLDSFKNGRTDGRGALAYLVRILPLLNRHACDLWRKEDQVPYLLALCDYLYTTGHRSRYLDGFPFRPTLPCEDQRGIMYPDLEKKPKSLPNLETVHVHRKKLAEKLSENPALFRDVLHGSTIHVPFQFHVCIWQMHFAFREHPRYDEVFTECQRVGCTRPALLKHGEYCEEEDEDNESSEAEYWKCCRDGDSPPPMSSLPSSMAFCCHGCLHCCRCRYCLYCFGYFYWFYWFYWICWIYWFCWFYWSGCFCHFGRFCRSGCFCRCFLCFFYCQLRFFEL